MKKFLRLLCLAAILSVAYLALTTPREGSEPAMTAIDAKTDDVATQVRGMYETYGQGALEKADAALGDAVKQADEALENAVEQVDEALGDAVESAALGAKQGFFESLKESVNEFWEKVFPKKEE